MRDEAKCGGRVEVRVRYAETDQMRRAHHGAYVVWCELGRTALMRESGISYAELERRGILLPVSRLEVEYRRGAEYEELVAVETRVSAVRSRSVTFLYDVLRSSDGELLARASTDLVCTDVAGRPRRMPAELRKALEELARADGAARPAEHAS
ncbi:MAG: acyl-CoA thioesterase [Gemmatimonadota bacterium]